MHLIKSIIFMPYRPSYNLVLGFFLSRVKMMSDAFSIFPLILPIFVVLFFNLPIFRSGNTFSYLIFFSYLFIFCFIKKNVMSFQII